MKQPQDRDTRRPWIPQSVNLRMVDRAPQGHSPQPAVRYLPVETLLCPQRLSALSEANTRV